MIIIRNDSVDPFFNLAGEEYLIDNCPDDVFMLWRDSPAVIIGRAQNAYAEINRAFTEANDIKVVRRLTGGGAVFHDLGNVNFTFIVRDGGGDIDFSPFTAPIIKALKKLGLDAELSGRNDILCRGAKISGNAQCRKNGRLLHHGTLLYGADLGKMSGALNVNAAKMKAKGVSSVRSRVDNIARLCGCGLDTVGFKAFLEDFASEEFHSVPREFDSGEKAGIEKLAREKYSRWEWNWGESKSYERTAERYFPYGLVSVGFTASGGYLTDVKINGDFFASKEISELERRLTGTKLEKTGLELALAGVGEYINSASPEDIAGLLLE